MTQTMTIGAIALLTIGCLVLGYLYYMERQKTSSVAISLEKGGVTVETK